MGRGIGHWGRQVSRWLVGLGLLLAAHGAAAKDWLAAPREACVEEVLSVARLEPSRDSKSRVPSTDSAPTTISDTCAAELKAFQRNKGLKTAKRELQLAFPEKSRACAQGLKQCLKALGVYSGREILGFARQSCSTLIQESSGLQESRSRRSEDNTRREPETSVPAVQRCHDALELLNKSTLSAAFDPPMERQKQHLRRSCLTPLENCRQGSCEQLPACVIALENLSCKGGECASWIDRRANNFRREQEIATRDLVEQHRARNERASQAEESLREASTLRQEQNEIAALDSLQHDLDHDQRQALAEASAQQAERLARLARESIEQIAKEDRDAANAANQALNEKLEDGLRVLQGILSRGQTAAAAPAVTRQIDPDQPVEQLFENVSRIEYGIVTLPHPAIPQHRRKYKSAAESIDSGMYAAGYNLAAYYDPWVEYREKDKGQASDRMPDSLQYDSFSRDARYGIRVYQHETWRKNESSSNAQQDCTTTSDTRAILPENVSEAGAPGTAVAPDAEKTNAPAHAEKTDDTTKTPENRIEVRLRVLYVVGEARTYGVQREAMAAALWRVVAEVYGAREPKEGPHTTQFGFIKAPKLVSSAQAKPDARDQCREPRATAAETATRETQHPTSSPSKDASNAHDVTELSTVFVIGPTFSGSVLGLLQSTQRLNKKLKERHLLTLATQKRLNGLRKRLDDFESRMRKLPIFYPTGSENLPGVAQTDLWGDDRYLTDRAKLLRAVKVQRQCLDLLEVAARPETSMKPVYAYESLGTACPEAKPNPSAKIRSDRLNPSTQKPMEPPPKTSGAGLQLRELDSVQTETSVVAGLFGGIDRSSKLKARSHIKVHAISASITATSNGAINKIDQNGFLQESLAVDDNIKIKRALELVDRSRANSRVAMLYEPTAFGSGAFSELKKANGNVQPGEKQDRPILGIHFPPNIADLRKHLRDSDSKARDRFSLINIQGENLALPIEESTENGNEFPETFDSKLAAVSGEQRLRLQLAQLDEWAPDAVIVVASDVRDRLYLFDRLSREMHAAQLVDLEADILLAHPNYLHATRGTTMISSAPLQPESDANYQKVCSTSEAGRAGTTDPLCRCSAVNPPAGENLQFDSDRNALLYTLTRCTTEIAKQETTYLYRMDRNGPTLLKDQAKSADGSWAACWDAIAPAAAAAGPLLLLLGCCVFFYRLLASFSPLSKPSTALLLAAPWWERRAVTFLPFAVHLCAAAVVVLLLALFMPQLHKSWNADHTFRVLMGLVLVAALAQVAWRVAARQLRHWTQYAELLIQSGNGNKPLADWSAIAGPKPTFVSTPLQAGLVTGLLDMTAAQISSTDAANQLARLEYGFQDSLAARMALRRALLPCLRTICLLALLSLLACVSIIVITHLSPVPGRSLPLLGSFVLLLSAATLLTGNLIAFERNGLLSMLFSGTGSGVQLSSAFLVGLVGPTLLVILSLIATDQPGMMDTAGGLLKLLMAGK